LDVASGSAITRLDSLEVASGSAITRLGALETASGSAITRLSSIESKTGSYATTGSNTFVDGQYLSSSFNPTGFSTTASLYTDGGLRVTRDAYISGTLYLNNVTVFGTQSVAYISSSQLNIGTNLITVNTDTPSIRFGGLAVYDSGSTGLTGSILWDSQNNHWVYSNPSGSSYSGGMFISGPRTSTLGSETGTTSCALMMGQGGDHITSSAILHYGNATCFYGTSFISSSGAACFAGSLTGSSAIFSSTLSATNLSAEGSPALGGIVSLRQDATYLPRGNGYSSIASSPSVFEFYGYTGASTYKNFTLRFDGLTNNTRREYTLPDACGTLALLSGTQAFTGTVCSTMVNASCIGIGTQTPAAPLTIKSTGATGILMACDGVNQTVSSRLFFESCFNQFSILNSGGKLQFNHNASLISTSGTLGMVMDSCGNLLIGTGTAAGTEKLGVTRDNGVGNGLHVIADFNRSLGSSAELVLGYMADGTNAIGPVIWSSNGLPLLFSAGSATRMCILSSGVTVYSCQICTPHLIASNNISIGSSCISTDGYNTRLRITNIQNDTFVFAFNNQACKPIMFMYGGNTVNPQGYTAWIDNTTGQTNHQISHNTAEATYFAAKGGFVGIGATSPQTYLHICDNLSAGRDDLIRLQTIISTNHAWMRSISCAGVSSIFGSNRANTDGNLIANHAVAGTTSGHNFDLISNSTVRVRLSSSGAVCLLGNSNDYPSLFLAGPTYTMIAMGDRSSSASTDVGYISIFNQGARTIDLPGNADPVVFNNGGGMIAGRAYASGDARFGYQFLEICNGQTYHGPLSLGNSGGGVALTPLYCGGGQRWGFGWNTAEMNNITNYNNCTPFLIAWGVNGDNPTTDRKFCFNYNGQAYATSGTWGTLSSNCIIKTCISAANSQWNDVKNICIVNYKMKEEIEEFGTAARMHLGVVAEQVAEVSPGLLEQGGYSEKWCACLNGVKTSILHMKAVKALQEAMCRIEILETCLGIN
jgi:hypothetical protein